MPRPRKCRRVCCMPSSDSFGPLNATHNEHVPIYMTVDEYETIRLIDLEGYTQQECSHQMNIARTTVQSIYDTARKKLADALVNGKRLIISGGNYFLCEHFGDKPCSRGCKKHCTKDMQISNHIENKKEN